MLIWLLGCCPSLLIIGLTQPVRSENLTRPEPYSKFYFGESRVDLQLPFYTSGFK